MAFLYAFCFPSVFQRHQCPLKAYSAFPKLLFSSVFFSQPDRSQVPPTFQLVRMYLVLYLCGIHAKYYNDNNNDGSNTNNLYDDTNHNLL